MSSQEYILLEANDCCPFENQNGHSEAIQHFVSRTSTLNVLHFRNTDSEEEQLPFATFNYRDFRWYAGRLVGEASFSYAGKRYKFKINPRFGVLQLFRMLEEVFNIRLTESTQNLLYQDSDLNYLVKKMLSFSWMLMLGKANRHGLPFRNEQREHRGQTIRGRLNIRKSIQPLYSEELVISNYQEKALDEIIGTILSEAYDILNRDYYLGAINLSPSAQDAIRQLSFVQTAKFIDENQYRKIVYRDIFKAYKPVVDLSWEIIKRNKIGNLQSDQDDDSYSFFIDMAELWELYLRSLLGKALEPYGWTLKNKKAITYSDMDFRRSLIPDIVLQRGNKIMVWDAKYKRMKFDHYDYDRTDFFQLHTYISYYSQFYEVFAGGLLYPLSAKFDPERQGRNHSESLYSLGQSETHFWVDGVSMPEDNELSTAREFFIEAEQSFIARVMSLTERRE